jgi:hypothetical protein
MPRNGCFTLPERLRRDADSYPVPSTDSPSSEQASHCVGHMTVRLWLWLICNSWRTMPTHTHTQHYFECTPCLKAGVHAPTKSVSLPAAISLLPPVQPRSGVHTHTDKIGIGACKAVNFVSDAEQATWLPCGIGGFICCVCFICGGDDV